MFCERLFLYLHPLIKYHSYYLLIFKKTFPETAAIDTEDTVGDIFVISNYTYDVSLVKSLQRNLDI